ncbi:MAG: hypothetical protein D3904_10555 [Candidatus Electrothrix sp. EH2]|nr:hypothetical protein [Candidatus Electrothrix sp. EH2]
MTKLRIGWRLSLGRIRVCAQNGQHSGIVLFLGGLPGKKMRLESLEGDQTALISGCTGMKKCVQAHGFCTGFPGAAAQFNVYSRVARPDALPVRRTAGITDQPDKTNIKALAYSAGGAVFQFKALRVLAGGSLTGKKETEEEYQQSDHRVRFSGTEDILKAGPHCGQTRLCS